MKWQNGKIKDQKVRLSLTKSVWRFFDIELIRFTIGQSIQSSALRLWQCRGLDFDLIIVNLIIRQTETFNSKDEMA